MTRVLLADDQKLVRAALRAILEPDFTVVAEAGDGAEAVRLTAELRPELVLMDIRMPGMDGLEATRRILAGAEFVRVVILTTYDLDEYVYAALRIGASGFAVKDMEPVELLYGLRAVARGEALLSPAVTRRLIGTFAGGPEPPSKALDLRVLTGREREVFELVVAGRSNYEIAAELGMRPATARTHLTRILAKLGARDRVQLVLLAYESGLVKPA
jgi:DNA-binding NarL/FixJ family response regulator